MLSSVTASFSNASVAQSSAQTSVQSGGSVAKKGLDIQKQLGENVVKLIDASVVDGKGGNVNTFA